MKAWGIEWHSHNHLDGEQRHLLWPEPCYRLFRTRQECRDYIDKHYGYIRIREDLRAEPHGWRLPRAVRVEVRVR